MSRCHVCGKDGCPSQADPPGGPFALHNAAAYARLLEERAAVGREATPPSGCVCGHPPLAHVVEAQPHYCTARGCACREYERVSHPARRATP